MKLFIFISFILLYLNLFSDWHEMQKLLASDGAEYDWFGCSVSISGDYAVIGAYGDEDNGQSSGSAYIFRNFGNQTWIEHEKLIASDGTPSDYFGKSVSISGDFVVVGASGTSDNGVCSGSVYIFYNNGSFWTELFKITPSDASEGDCFGRSVCIDGNYLIVASLLDDDNGHHSGSAYIFHWDGTTWSEQDKLLASDGTEDDFFGCSVSISGDYAIIGAQNDDDNGENSGSVYVFQREETTWFQQTKLTAVDGAENDCFGFSVSISGNYTVVGAPYDDDNESGSGSAYIFIRTGTNWFQYAKLLASDGAHLDFFGCSVSISGNYAVIGAYGDDDNDITSGSAYVFYKEGTTWSQQVKLNASDGAIYDHFGNSVCISDNNAVIGAYRDSDYGTDSGSAYIFHNDAVSVEDENIQYSIDNLQLSNFPNPFNQETTIKYNIKKNGNALLTIYNIKGQEITSIQCETGSQTFHWNAENFPSGIYLYKLQSSNLSQTRKMILLK